MLHKAREPRDGFPLPFRLSISHYVVDYHHPQTITWVERKTIYMRERQCVYIVSIRIYPRFPTIPQTLKPLEPSPLEAPPYIPLSPLPLNKNSGPLAESVK